MVYINQVELSNFKSFGGSITIPLEEGFTVVTGPNGSGKSNILDGVLFCLGLATSRGMRADRLPDLVNSSLLKAGKSAETVVSVKFDLTDWEPDLAEDGLEKPIDGPWIKPDQKEWVVTRRLRVMPGGSYSSSYSSDGESCNLQQLQTQLRRLRVDPEGSNVVMQGDVTRIVSMTNKDRRGLIDELAGVALFDSRIEQTKTKLDDVQERQERCRIVEQELLTSRHKLERDCAKARKYNELRKELDIARQIETVLIYQTTKKRLADLDKNKENLRKKAIEDSEKNKDREQRLIQSAENLKILQANVKALGEDKLIAVQAEIAGLETQIRELDRQASYHKEQGEKLQEQRQVLITKRSGIQDEKKVESKTNNHQHLDLAEQECIASEAAVEVSRRRLGEVADRSGAWLQSHKERISRRQELQNKLRPLQEEEQKLGERLLQINSREEELKGEQQRDISVNQLVSEKLDKLDKSTEEINKEIVLKKQIVQELTDSIAIQQRTRNRLENEQVRLEREIARLESRRETLQESRGTSALRILLESGLSGIHGPVFSLGKVEKLHRLALDVAAGSRLGQIVVDDDQIAAKAIELLKSKKAGRLTFLPLNRLKSVLSKSNLALQRATNSSLNIDNSGFVGRAIDLVNFEPIYKDVFAYVLGETIVFSDLTSARTLLGKNRSVTIEGELLEKSGAMTGGSFSNRGLGLSFGISKDMDEIEPMRQRLLELGQTLNICKQKESSQIQELDSIRPILRDLEQRQAAIKAERKTSFLSNGPLIERRQERSERLLEIDNMKIEYKTKLNSIAQELLPLNDELNVLESNENGGQVDADSKNWQRLKIDLEEADKNLIKARLHRDELLNDQRQRELLLERLDDQQKVLAAEEIRLQEAIKSLALSHQDWRKQQNNLHSQKNILEKKQKELQNSFGEQRRARDEAEALVAKEREELQDSKWKVQRINEEIQALMEEIRCENVRLVELEKTLPDPLPTISSEIQSAGLEVFQTDLQNIQNRMEALEPVNMLALDELEELEKRLTDLMSRLETLSEERSELLLRIETVATLREEAFLEAFNAVDIHFRDIFASLSDGDGHLQLDNSDDPLEGGLTLVAHPRGKAVRRLAAMSGGEKSLTALSFLFALQRFRPSPFYALDEVDSFLDGINVERLSALIAKQSEQAQFLVVSHRRPMIGASSRTIGVTQARGAHTQVVGLPNAA